MKKWAFIFFGILVFSGCEKIEEDPLGEDNEETETLDLQAFNQDLCSGNSTYILIVDRPDLYGSMVNWEIEPAIGSIDAGLYTSPDQLEENVEVTVHASLSSNPKIKGSIVLNLVTSDGEVSVRELKDLKFQPIDVVFTDDGGFISSSARFAIILNNKAPSTQIGDTDFLVNKFDAEGNLKWTKNFGRGNSEKIILYDDYIYVLGRINSIGLLLVKLNLNGNVIDEFELENAIGSAMDIDSNGNVVLGYYMHDGNVLKGNRMLKLDFGLKHLWELDFADKGITSIKISGQGNIFYAYQEFEIYPQSGIGYLLEDGRELWETEPQAGYWNINKIIQAGAFNEVVGVFQMMNSAYTITKEQVFIIDPEGVKTEVISFDNSLGFQRVKDVIVSENQEIYLLCDFEANKDLNDIGVLNFRVIKTDKSGNVLETLEYVKSKNPHGSINYNLMGKVVDVQSNRLSFFVYTNKMFLINTDLNFEISECQRRKIF